MSPRTPNWVSKTDLTRYLRCPYAFYLLDRGLIPFEDAVNEQQVRLIQEGILFQQRVEAKALPVSITPSELPKVFATQSIRLFGVPVLEHTALEIYGKPDAIDTAQGALFPVEVKSHKDIQRTDELELAFYWMLLEPYRTRLVSPRGFLVLRSDGYDKLMEVELTAGRFEQVRELLSEIRNARQCGVRPRICTCTVCSGVMRDQILRATTANRDLTMIWDIGHFRARHLEAIGITNYDDLLAADTTTIIQRLYQRQCFASASQVERWKHHAKSYATLRPAFFGDRLQLDGSFIALDLEYDGGLIWLVGVCLVTCGRPEYFALWADLPVEELNNIERLAEIVLANPSLPLLTWSGTGADMPQLKNAARRLNLNKPFEVILSRHLDLFQQVKNTVRFPIPQLSLRELAGYFAIPRISKVRDGLQAQFFYQEYRRCQDSDRKASLRTMLLEYNRDDLEALVKVTERLVALRPDASV
jgi:predicted RecB family nuclease